MRYYWIASASGAAYRTLRGGVTPSRSFSSMDSRSASHSSWVLLLADPASGGQPAFAALAVMIVPGQQL
jgi:hypothetical protein